MVILATHCCFFSFYHLFEREHAGSMKFCCTVLQSSTFCPPPSPFQGQFLPYVKPNTELKLHCTNCNCKILPSGNSLCRACHCTCTARTIVLLTRIAHWSTNAESLPPFHWPGIRLFHKSLKTALVFSENRDGKVSLTTSCHLFTPFYRSAHGGLWIQWDLPLPHLCLGITGKYYPPAPKLEKKKSVASLRYPTIISLCKSDPAAQHKGMNR